LTHCSFLGDPWSVASHRCIRKSVAKSNPLCDQHSPQLTKNFRGYVPVWFRQRDHSGSESSMNFKDSQFADKSDRMRAARPKSRILATPKYLPGSSVCSSAEWVCANSAMPGFSGQANALIESELEIGSLKKCGSL
jgi:hypothetical protein